MEVPFFNYYAQKCVDFVPFPGALGGGGAWPRGFLYILLWPDGYDGPDLTVCHQMSNFAMMRYFFSENVPVSQKL